MLFTLQMKVEDGLHLEGLGLKYRGILNFFELVLSKN